MSFATTMPEIIVSVAAALDGHSAMAIGNAVGSVSANTGIILALSLFFLPVAIKREEYLFKNSLYIGTLPVSYTHLASQMEANLDSDARWESPPRNFMPEDQWA